MGSWIKPWCACAGSAGLPGTKASTALVFQEYSCPEPLGKAKGCGWVAFKSWEVVGFGMSSTQREPKGRLVTPSPSYSPGLGFLSSHSPKPSLPHGSHQGPWEQCVVVAIVQVTLSLLLAGHQGARILTHLCPTHCGQILWVAGLQVPHLPNGARP